MRVCVCVFFFGYLTQISTFLYIETLAFSDDFFFPLRLMLGSKFHDIFHSVLFLLLLFFYYFFFIVLMRERFASAVGIANIKRHYLYLDLHWKCKPPFSL